MSIKIVHCVDSIDKSAGGPSRSIPNICKSLSHEKLFEPYILTYQSPNPNIVKANIKYVILDKENNVFSFLTAANLKNVLSQFKNAIFHGHVLWGRSLHCMCAYCIKNNIRYVISPRGTLEPWALNNKSFKKKIALKLYQFHDLKNAFCIHATSEMEANNIRKVGLSQPIAVIPNGVDVNEYKLKDYSSNNDVTFLFLSRIDKKKGIEILLEAWRLMNNPQFKLIIAGDGDEEYILYIKHLIAELPSQLNVIYVGPKYGDEKLKLYHDSDIFVLPSYSENFGMVIAEAMSCGLPVITTKATPWEALEKFDMGWWINNNVEDLVSVFLSINNMTKNDIKFKGIKSRQFVTENFSLKATQEKFIALYRWMDNPELDNLDFLRIDK